MVVNGVQTVEGRKMSDPTKISDVITYPPNASDQIDVGVAWRLDLNPSVTTEDEDRLHAQTRTILERLKRGPISNVNMSDISMQYNARVYELRAMLEPKGFTIAIIQKQPAGVNIYAIVTGINKKRPRKGKKQKPTPAQVARCKGSQAGRDLQACRKINKTVVEKQPTLF